MARIIVQAPDPVILKLEHALSYWLEVQAKVFVDQEVLFFQLVRRLLKLKSEGDLGADSDPVGHAINHPIGHVTEALLRWWYRQVPRDTQGLANEVKQLFTELCNTQVEMYRHGRVLLAAHAIALFRVDEEWSRSNLLPLFDWHKSELEARAAWEGFLWSPRLYWPLLSAIKQPILETATHYTKLGRHADQFSAFLTFAALDPGETFTKDELALATKSLPIEGLGEAAQTLVRALEGAGEQRVEYWRNRVLLYLKWIWPKSQEISSPAVSESLARLCVAAREVFPEAFDQLQHWLKPVNHPDYLVDQFHEMKICEKYPAEALAFLNIIIGNDAQWLPHELQLCLDQIKLTNPSLSGKPSFIRLIDLIRRRGIS
ncbi:MAG: hypothetical protein ABIU05_11710 [Nitrospirales bacterium]